MDVTVYDYYEDLRRYFEEVEAERENYDPDFFIEDYDEHMRLSVYFTSPVGSEENIVKNCRLKYDSSVFPEDSVIYHVRAQHKDYLEFFNHGYHINYNRGVHEFRILQLTSNIVIKMLESRNAFKGLSDIEESSIKDKIETNARNKYIIEYRSSLDHDDMASQLWGHREPYLAENNDIEDTSLFFMRYIKDLSVCNIFIDKSEALSVVCKNIHDDWLVEEIKPFSINNGVNWLSKNE